MNDFGDTAVSKFTNGKYLFRYLTTAEYRILKVGQLIYYTVVLDTPHSAKTINVSSDDPTKALSEEVLELANGCLCCSIKDTGIAAIEKLMKRKGAFDHILLETTGLADPGSFDHDFAGIVIDINHRSYSIHILAKRRVYPRTGQ